jgi:hypothetical protein
MACDIGKTKTNIKEITREVAHFTKYCLNVKAMNLDSSRRTKLKKYNWYVVNVLQNILLIDSNSCSWESV